MVDQDYYKVVDGLFWLRCPYIAGGLGNLSNCLDCVGSTIFDLNSINILQATRESNYWIFLFAIQGFFSKVLADFSDNIVADP
ncbi:hypothetical protein D9M71_631090 [compost metagenome]